jgi:formate dehydrogenase iron-sulfur subunit
MEEEIVDGKLNWLFFPDQCRHCIEPPCRDALGDPTAIFKDEATGAVIYTANTENYDSEEIRGSCPYDIPRSSENGTVAKCDMCLDRVQNGLLPACVATCPTGTMNFGEREKILEMAGSRLAEVKKTYPSAQLLDADAVEVIYLVVHDPLLYHKNAVAALSDGGITRHMALGRMINPLMKAFEIF